MVVSVNLVAEPIYNLIPIGRILSRAGHNPAWCLLILFPFLNMILLWVLAFKSWPIDKKPAPQP